jgi:hypothetical protein
MTKTTEELKREMYDRLADVKNSVANGHVPGISLDRYESSFEAYLEALRQELQMWKDIADERDLRSANLRNKLQAFEFANRSAAELLSEALREPSELRKTEGGTSGQNKEEPRPCMTCGGFGAVVCMHSFFAIGDDQMKCTFCGVVK